MQGLVAQIRGKLDRAVDADVRKALQRQLAEARAAIAKIESRWNDDGVGSPGDAEQASTGTSSSEGRRGDGRKLSSVDELLAELLVDPDEIERSSAEPEIVEEAITTARRRVLERANGTAKDRVAAAAQSPGHQLRSHQTAAAGHQPTVVLGRGLGHQRVRQSGPTPRSTTALRVGGAFALAAIVGTAGVLLLASREQPAEITTTTDDPVDRNHELEELEEILAIFGFDALDVERDGSLIRVSGNVADADRLQVARDAAAALVGPNELDTSGIVIERISSGVSESPVPVGTDRVEPTLQRDLDRILNLTPIVFDPGRSELGELDRRILNAVVALIVSAPEAKVTIIAHADADGPNDGDIDLANARAGAVRDYLAQQGVSDDALTAEGRATATASGIPGAIELDVTLEAAGP